MRAITREKETEKERETETEKDREKESFSFEFPFFVFFPRAAHDLGRPKPNKKGDKKRTPPSTACISPKIAVDRSTWTPATAPPVPASICAEKAMAGKRVRKNTCAAGARMPAPRARPEVQSER